MGSESSHALPTTPVTLAALLRRRARVQPDQTAYVFLTDGDEREERITYAGLDRRVRSLAALLATRGARGERVLLLYAPGLDYVAGFLACLAAGAIAVPVYPPDPRRLARTLPRIEAVVADAGARFVLTTAEIRAMKPVLAADAAGLAALDWLAAEDAPANHATLGSSAASAATDATIDAAAAAAANAAEHDDDAPRAAADDVAMLQYTSGSTGSPRGVMLTHDNLRHNSAAIERCFDHGRDSVGVIWLPPYHDMGLIGGVLQPLYTGFPVVLLSPLDFLSRPVRWLRAISRHRATISGGPNFAYDLCARKVSAEERAGLDLSSWGLAFNGAEPVRAETIDRFCEAFAPCGFRREAFYPCYGLAEATLLVTGGRKGGLPTVRRLDAAELERGRALPLSDTPDTPDTPDAPDAVGAPAPNGPTLVSSGSVIPGHAIVLVDPEARRPVPDRSVGEIWVRGPSVASGYWGRADETAATFGGKLVGDELAGESWLRTGDLGFADGGDLFVTGRIKDLLIVRGRNYYPHDLERTALACHPALRPGCAAAFAVPNPDGADHLVLVHELDAREPVDGAALAGEIRGRIAEEHGIEIHQVLLIAAGTISKTSSGKIQRAACRADYLAGRLSALATSGATGAELEAAGPGEGDALDVGRLRERPADERDAFLTGWVLRRVAAALELPVARVERARPLVRLGLDSLRSVELRAGLERAIGAPIASASALLDDLSADQLIEACRRALNAEVPDDAAPSPAVATAPRVPRGVDQPLSPAQEAIWLAARQSPGRADGFLISAALDLRGPLRVDWLTRALEAVVARHEALRTCFPQIDGRPRQRVLEPAPVVLAVEEAPPWSGDELERWVDQRAAAEAGGAVDLELGPLYRARLLRLAEDRWVLLVVVHHVVADGWSMRILIDEVTAVYRALHRGEPITLPELPYQVVDHAEWQRRRLTGDRRAALSAYWRDQLAGLPDEQPLPGARAPAEPPDGRGRALHALLPTATARALARACAGHGVTPFMWLLSAFDVLLFQETRRADLAVGVASLGRQLPGSERLIGNFVNLLPLRARLRGDMSFAELVAQTRRTTLDALAHQELPHELLLRDALPELRARGLSAFRVAFGVQNQPREPLRLPGLVATPRAVDDGAARLDLTLWVSEVSAGLQCSWTYATRLFEPATIERLHRRYAGLVDATLADPARRLAELPADDAGDHDRQAQAVRSALDRLGHRRARRAATGEGDPA